jgi:hypothetical protein
LPWDSWRRGRADRIRAAADFADDLHQLRVHPPQRIEQAAELVLAAGAHVVVRARRSQCGPRCSRRGQRAEIERSNRKLERASQAEPTTIALTMIALLRLNAFSASTRICCADFDLRLSSASPLAVSFS